MKTLIIYAHPGPSHFCARFLEKTKNCLEGRGVDYQVWDLYKMGYDPLIKSEEVYTGGKDWQISEKTRQLQKELNSYKRIIFIYPIWWGGMPAILKGFLDRTLTPGFAFKFRSDKFVKSIPEKYFQEKKILALVSSGAPGFFYFLILNPIKLLNKFFIFGFIGASSRTKQIYGARKLTTAKKKQIDKLVNRGLSWLLN